MKKLFLPFIVAAALIASGCGTTAEQACAPYGGVAQVGDDEGLCNGRDNFGDRVQIENDGGGWEIDDVD